MSLADGAAWEKENGTAQQADGYVEHDEGQDLVEEIAATATIEELMDSFIQEVSEMYADLQDTSLEGNAVKTHLEIQAFGQELWEMAYELKDDLVNRVANRSEEFAEKGGSLRKQVVDEQQES